MTQPRMPHSLMGEALVYQTRQGRQQTRRGPRHVDGADIIPQHIPGVAAAIDILLNTWDPPTR